MKAHSRDILLIIGEEGYLEFPQLVICQANILAARGTLVRGTLAWTLAQRGSRTLGGPGTLGVGLCCSRNVPETFKK